MSVQIFGSTLFNVSQVVAGLFLSEFGGTLKGKVSSQEMKEGIFFSFFSSAVFSVPQNLHVLSRCLISGDVHSVRRRRITCAALNVLFPVTTSKNLMVILLQSPFVDGDSICFSSLDSAQCQRS